MRVVEVEPGGDVEVGRLCEVVGVILEAPQGQSGPENSAQGLRNGDCYNLSNRFIITSRRSDGCGCRAAAAVYWCAEGGK